MTNNIAQFYTDVDPSRAATEYPHIPIEVLALFEPGRSNRLLDIGCYDGSKTTDLAAYVQAQQVCGVDFLAGRLVAAHQRGVAALVADLNTPGRLPYADGSFDCIFVGDVIEHLFSPDVLLAEIRRLLHPRGYAVLTTPNLASWRNRIALLMGWQPFATEVSTQYRVGNPRAPAGKPSGHIRVFTPRALRELVALHGLRVERLNGVVLPVAPRGLARLTALVDGAVSIVTPLLCDELAIKVRRVG